MDCEQGGRRGQQRVGARDLPRGLVTLLAPAERAALHNRVGLANRGNHGAVRQLADRSRYGMGSFAGAVQPLLVQYGIHLRRERRLPSFRLGPGGTKCLGISAAAEEARAVPTRPRSPSGRYGIGSFAGAVQPLLVQYGTYLRRERRLPSFRLGPGGTKCLGISA